MITVVTDNLEEHTIFVSYSFYCGDCLTYNTDKGPLHWRMFTERPTSVAKVCRKNVLYEELEEPFI